MRKRRAESASGVSREGERERTADDVSKCALDIETGSRSLARDEPGGYLIYCPGGVRHGGGASSVQALARNVGTCRPDTDGRSLDRLGPPVARGRTPSSGNCEGQSTEAGHRDGPARSSDEAR